MLYRVPLVFDPQPEGGFTVTSPALPELLTEGDTLAEAYAHAQDALAAVVELYADEGPAATARGVRASRWVGGPGGRPWWPPHDLS